MLYRLKRHPLEVQAEFGHCLVLAYAVPAQQLNPLLPPGLVLDEFEGAGFVAIALVQTRRLRPSFVPRWMGKNFFLAGYRIFTRFQTERGQRRGLRILRSLTDSRVMRLAGNMLTHYDYRRARVQLTESDGSLRVEVHTRKGDADLDVTADLASAPAPLPPTSPFSNLEQALEYAGPLPWTFDYEQETHSIVQIKGERDRWSPTPVSVTVDQNTFLDRPEFQGAALASAFHMHGIHYRWKPGILTALEAGHGNT